MNTYRSLAFIAILLLSCFAKVTFAEDDMRCPAYLNHSYRKLHSDEQINLCSLPAGKAVLVVNTASHCGFTKQFGPLEDLYQKYKDKGLVMVGFASDDFNQEDKDEGKAATICFENFGVTFTMLAPTSVKGDAANPTFAWLDAQTEAPSWNFNKYLVTDKGTKVQHFPSKVVPLDSPLEEAVKQALGI